MLNIFKKKKSSFDVSDFGLGCIPSPPDERDLYIHFLDGDGTAEIYKMVNGQHVHIKYENIKVG